MIKKIIDILDSNEVIAYSDEAKLNVDMEETISNLGILLKEEPLESTVHGLVRSNNSNGLEIVVHSDLPKENKKMTIAHELGHALIHFPRKNIPEYKDSVFYQDSYITHTREEQEANAFAIELIMPEYPFRDFIRNNTEEGKIDLSRVSKAFGVSISMADMRAHELHLIN